MKRLPDTSDEALASLIATHERAGRTKTAAVLRALQTERQALRDRLSDREYDA